MASMSSKTVMTDAPTNSPIDPPMSPARIGEKCMCVLLLITYLGDIMDLIQIMFLHIFVPIHLRLVAC